MTNKQGYYDEDLLAEQLALLTLVLVVLAKKQVTPGTDDPHGWVGKAEENARGTLARIKRQAAQRAAL